MKFVDLTGGARIGFKNASWPFARFIVSRKELRLHVKLIGKYSFSAKEIEKLEAVKIVPLLGRGIRIHHNKAEYPKKIIFWSLSDPQKVIERINKSDFLNQAQAK